jgi:phosphatidylglycerol lysyltransferase
MRKALPDPQPEARERALSLLRRFGWNATSFQSMEPGIRYWLDPEEDACVAYADTGRAWVVAGAPVAAEERLAEVAGRFMEEARRQGRRVCFFATERRFAGAVALHSLPIGEQPVWDPARWPAVLQSSRSLREQLRRARAKGVVVRQAPPEAVGRPTSEVRQAIEALISRWLSSRSMAPMGFLVRVDPFSLVAERRIFVAELAGKVVAFLAMVPVYARGGWLFEDLVADPSAPNGTSELLIDQAMRTAAEEGSRYATLGLAPLSGEVSGWLRTAGRLGARLYNFEGLRAFKNKLRPSHWEPIFLSYPPGQNGALTMLDVLSAFAPGGLLRFALATLLRVPAIPLRALAVLLVPWTLLLAAAPTAQWFPFRWIQEAWGVFDVGLCLGLLALCSRWRQWLAALLASLITADAFLTLWEVLAFNWPRARTGLEWGVSVVAVLGPLLTALFLWGAWERQGRVRRSMEHGGAGQRR